MLKAPSTFLRRLSPPVHELGTGCTSRCLAVYLLCIHNLCIDCFALRL